MLMLYDLAGRDETIRFSPFCWRTRLALGHKGLPVKTIPWRLTEKNTIEFSGQGLVPVLVDGGIVISDSWSIAQYLDDAYPDMPALFAGVGARALTGFVNGWTDSVLNPAVRQVILPDIVPLLHKKDVEYFVRSREQRFGIKIEEYVERRDEYLAHLADSLTPLRVLFARQSYLGGEHPSYADHIVMSAFIWAKICCPVRFWEEDNVIAHWFERMSGVIATTFGDAPPFRW